MKQREIKFRAWDGEQMISPDYIDRNGMAWWKENSIPTFNVQPMQFTGLHDKNGREIYDRDIVDGYDGLRFDVQWLEYDAEWNIGGYDAKRMDVIGNCFENPELIPTN